MQNTCLLDRRQHLILKTHPRSLRIFRPFPSHLLHPPQTAKYLINYPTRLSALPRYVARRQGRAWLYHDAKATLPYYYIDSGADADLADLLRPIWAACPVWLTAPTAWLVAPPLAAAEAFARGAACVTRLLASLAFACAVAPCLGIAWHVNYAVVTVRRFGLLGWWGWGFLEGAKGARDVLCAAHTGGVGRQRGGARNRAPFCLYPPRSLALLPYSITLNKPNTYNAGPRPSASGSSRAVSPAAPRL